MLPPGTVPLLLVLLFGQVLGVSAADDKTIVKPKDDPPKKFTGQTAKSCKGKTNTITLKMEPKIAKRSGLFWRHIHYAWEEATVLKCTFTGNIQIVDLIKHINEATEKKRKRRVWRFFRREYYKKVTQFKADTPTADAPEQAESEALEPDVPLKSGATYHIYPASTGKPPKHPSENAGDGEESGAEKSIKCED